VQGIWCSDFEVMLSVDLQQVKNQCCPSQRTPFRVKLNATPLWEFKFNSFLAAAAIWHLKGPELKVKTTFHDCQLVQLLEVNALVVLFHRPARTL
jgi:hypothetical protein